MVEADYRMKLIGIGLEEPPVRLTSYVDRANPAPVASNALQRWYFVPDYQCVRVSDDALAMQLVGDGVKLVGEDEVVSKDGKRKRGRQEQPGQRGASSRRLPRSIRNWPSGRRFTPSSATASTWPSPPRSFSTRTITSAAKWTAETLRNEQAYPVETLNPPSKSKRP